MFDLLHLLVRNPGRLVSRDESLPEVWNGRIVSESAISARIAAARKAARIPGAELMVLETANHIPIPGNAVWDEYQLALLGFLGEQAAAP